ncbi:hypothetical protein F9K87_06165 [Brucella anthropi]|uniref:hypothetical protein n=1 Tax=Brucella anthropi TaxID=529 RepID=UPI00124C1D8C|nr:hypothetical protein [Brucella anthropi]KAB2801015.1 hypothetical protein F9K87_06165 [Brucella anthropi]
MSAMAAAIVGEKIHLFADAIFYDDDGIVSAIHPKIWKVPGLNASFISRGQGRAFPYFQMIVQECGFETWDELKSGLPEVWETLDALMDYTPMDIMIAGFSEKNDRPEVLYRHTVKSNEDGVLAAGNTYIYTEGAFSFGCSIEYAEDICAEAIRAFERSRNEKCDINGFHAGRRSTFAHAIGGRLQHVELTREGDRGEVLLVWPDEIGKRIVPLAA